jgi:Ca2+-binding RTX toxin-like protein
MAVVNGTSGPDVLDYAQGVTDLADIISGLEGDDTLYGHGGDDTLDGGTGADVMQGGEGNDTYIVDDAGDSVFEAIPSNQPSGFGGVDTVMASISHNAGFLIENVTLTGSDNINALGNALGNVLVGNSGNNILVGGGGVDHISGGAGADVLYGGVGKDVLDGGEGADVMYGGADHDIFYVDNVNDVVIETDADNSDPIFWNVIVSSVDYTLPRNVRYLMLAGTDNLNAYGNDQVNQIYGNAGDNYLWGGDGQDILIGFYGNDVFDGGNGNDALLLNTAATETVVFSIPLGPNNLDRIGAFTSGQDQMHLDHDIFPGLAMGALEEDAFTSLGVADTADQRIIYDPGTGLVSYDDDGTGPDGQTAFAQMDLHTPLSYQDFVVV